MGYNMIRQGDTDIYGINQYITDTLADLYAINLQGVAPGSSATVLEPSSKYILNTRKDWILIQGTNNCGCSTSTSSIGIENVTIDGKILTFHMSDGKKIDIELPIEASKLNEEQVKTLIEKYILDISEDDIKKLFI